MPCRRGGNSPWFSEIITVAGPGLFSEGGKLRSRDSRECCAGNFGPRRGAEFVIAQVLMVLRAFLSRPTGAFVRRLEKGAEARDAGLANPIDRLIGGASAILRRG